MAADRVSDSPLAPGVIADYLSAADPVLAGLVRELGPLALPKDGGGLPSLVRAIIFQQISGAAGASILRRTRRAFGPSGFPTAGWFATVPDRTLAAAGLSPQKIGYLRDLARHVLEGRLDLRRLRSRTDGEIIEALTEVRGIGTWTAQMYLIFSLNRPDVLPVGDLGVRKAVGRAWRYRSLPAESTVARIGRRWAPYRSFATYYLWQSLANERPTPRPAARRPGD